MADYHFLDFLYSVLSNVIIIGLIIRYLILYFHLCCWLQHKLDEITMGLTYSLIIKFWIGENINMDNICLGHSFVDNK